MKINRSYILGLVLLLGLGGTYWFADFVLATEVTIHPSYVVSIERVSVNNAGEEGNNWSDFPRISGDGRYVVFQSLANNLVVSDTNGMTGWDIFLYDRETKQIELISRGLNGESGNGSSTQVDISEDGRYIVFQSYATNLVPTDTNGFIRDIFVYDREMAQMALVSVNSEGGQANGNCSFAVISGDGQFVAYHSYANNLVLNDTNSNPDIYVYDRDLNITERVSVRSTGEEGLGSSTTPSISADGRYVAFDSTAYNLVVSDTMSIHDVFVHDRWTHETKMVSVNSQGEQANDRSVTPWLSGNGQYVVFHSDATNLVEDLNYFQTQIYLHDMTDNETTLISKNGEGVAGNHSNALATISNDGSIIAYHSSSTNLTSYPDENKQADVFIFDRLSNLTMRISEGLMRLEGNDKSLTPSLSTDGSIIAFWSEATNLVSNDMNGAEDTFVVEWHIYRIFLPIVQHD